MNWKIFTSDNKDKLFILQEIERWKNFVFSKINRKVKKFYAKRVISTFDNKMLISAASGFHESLMHDNLMESLSLAEEELSNYSIVFNDIKLFVMFDGSITYLAVCGLSNDDYLYPTSSNGYVFQTLDLDAELIMKNLNLFKHNSFETSVFNIELSDFYLDWINFVPSLQERCEFQAKKIVLDSFTKDKTKTLEEITDFETNIENNAKFKDVLLKIKNIMPKLSPKLDDEWKATNDEHLKQKKKKK